MNILEFANPIGWWWAALAVPLALLYVLKVRLRRQTVSTFLFWDQVFQEKKPRSWWQQLRHLLSLLLQLAFLMLLVLALVDPLWQWQKAQRRKVLVVVDNSASMAASDAGQSRLDRAKETAAALVRSLRVGDEMAILSAGGKPEVVLGLTDHSRTLLEAVAAIEQTDAPSELSDTVLAAKRLLAGDTRSVVYVLTDGCDRAIASMRDDPSINLVGFGQSQNNVGITQFQVRRSLLDAIGYQVLIEVSNFSDTTYRGRLELDLEGQLVDVIPLELQPEEHKTLHLDQASASGGRLMARLDSDDALTSDNQALAVLPTRRPILVTLTTPGSLFLKSVLESIPLVDLKVAMPPSSPDSAGAATDDSAAELQAVPLPRLVLAPEFQRPIMVLDRAIPEQLPPGKLLVINPAHNCQLWTLGDVIAQPIVTSVSLDSPVTQHVKLSNVLFPRAQSITFTQDAEVLIKTALDEPLLARLRRPAGDVLVLNVNLDEGDLPLRIAFPVLMKNALEWFDGSQGELQPALATGTTTKVLLPQPTSATGPNSSKLPTDDTTANSSTPANDNQPSQLARLEPGKPTAGANESDTAEASAETLDYWVRDPLGRLTPLAHDAEAATLSVLKHSGLWAVGTAANLSSDPWLASDSPPGTSPPVVSVSSPTADAGKLTGQASASTMQTLRIQAAVRHLACNVSSRAESDVRPQVELPSANQLGLMSLGGRSIWFYCVCAALALTAIEWWLYQRRIVG